MDRPWLLSVRLVGYLRFGSLVILTSGRKRGGGKITPPSLVYISIKLLIAYEIYNIDDELVLPITLVNEASKQREKKNTGNCTSALYRNAQRHAFLALYNPQSIDDSPRLS